MFQYSREYFWHFVSLGLTAARVRPDLAIKALSRVMRREIDLYIGGNLRCDPQELAQYAIEYVQYVTGEAPIPSWFVPFDKNWPQV